MFIILHKYNCDALHIPVCNCNLMFNMIKMKSKSQPTTVVTSCTKMKTFQNNESPIYAHLCFIIMRCLCVCVRCCSDGGVWLRLTVTVVCVVWLRLTVTVVCGVWLRLTVTVVCVVWLRLTVTVVCG